MKRSYILPLFALLGIIISAIVIFENNRPMPINIPVIQPPESPWSSNIAGVGIIETALGNAALSTPVAGIVTKIYVKVGDHAKAGDPLFKMDDRDLQAQLLTTIAKVNEAKSTLNLHQHQLEFAEQLARKDPDAISPLELSNLRDEAKQAKSSLELTQAQVKQVKIEIDRRIIRAPANGQVLKIEMRPGEYVDGNNAAAPIMLFGQDDNLFVRVDIDENDEWRFQSDAKAIMFIRGNRNINMPLNFEYIEPYITPKTALTGKSTERTDRRVFQVIYSFVPGDLPVHVGQQVDVFIQAKTVTQQSDQKDN